MNRCRGFSAHHAVLVVGFSQSPPCGLGCGFREAFTRANAASSSFVGNAQDFGCGYHYPPTDAGWLDFLRCDQIVQLANADSQNLCGCWARVNNRFSWSRIFHLVSLNLSLTSVATDRRVTVTLRAVPAAQSASPADPRSQPNCLSTCADES